MKEIGSQYTICEMSPSNPPSRMSSPVNKSKSEPLIVSTDVCVVKRIL